MGSAIPMPCPVCGLPAPDGAEVCPHDGSPLWDAAPTQHRDPLLGLQVGEYVVKGMIGRGGMGVVYEGLQPIIGKRVAIKVLRGETASDPHESQRLLTEARTVNAIGHRGIIDIFSFGALADGRQYFVMEYLDGCPLSAHIRENAPLQLSEATQILEELLSALGAAHGAGVIHRDLKPSNIFLVSQPDGSSFVKVLDFGLAKQAPLRGGDTPQTRVSRVLGTPEFMAPEQARGEAVGPRTDLYALGCVAFEMLTGRLPFAARTAFEVINMHLNAPAPRPSSIVTSVPPELDEVVLRLLEKRPEDRPPSAEVVRQQLRKLRKELGLQLTRLAVISASISAVPPPRPPEAAITTRPLRPDETERQPTAPAVEQRPTAPMAAAAPNRKTEALSRVFNFDRRRGLAVGLGAAAGLALILGLTTLRASPEPLPGPAPGGPELPRPTSPPPGPPVEVPVKIVEPREKQEPVAQPPDPKLDKPAAVAIEAPRHKQKPRRKEAAQAEPRPSLGEARAKLLSRIDALESGGPAGRPDQVALMLLTDARVRARAAGTSAELRAVSTFVDEWEQKFAKR